MTFFRISTDDTWGTIKAYLGEGEMTDDGRFGLETVACLGTCFLAPVVMVDHDYFGSVAPQRVPEILAEYE